MLLPKYKPFVFYSIAYLTVRSTVSSIYIALARYQNLA